MVAIVNITDLQIMQFGIKFAGHAETSPKSDLENFKSCYGIVPETAKSVFDMLQSTTNEVAKIEKPDPLYFFMTLYWMHNYLTESLMCAVFKIKSRKTFRKYAWIYIEAIQSLKETVVR